MVLPTKELLSTLNPFTVLTPEENHGIISREEKQRREAASPSPSPSSAATLKLEEKCGGGDDNKHEGDNDDDDYEDRLGGCTCILSMSTAKPARHSSSASASSASSTSTASTSIISAPVTRDALEECELASLVSGTTTLEEARLTQDDIENRRGTGFIGIVAAKDSKNYADNNERQERIYENVDCQFGTGNSDRILNFLNAATAVRNSSFLSKNKSTAALNGLSNGSSSTFSSKFSEDLLFSDLKSRFIERHFRTILRSQESKDEGKYTKHSSDCGQLWTVNNNNNNNNNVSVNNNNSSSISFKEGFATLLKPLKIITVDRPKPEPKLDLPRLSYLKSGKEKFLKMHEQAKSQALERYRKLCTSFRTNVLPRLHPVQVLIEILFSNLFTLLTSPFVLVAVILLCFLRLAVGIVLRVRYKGRYKLMSGSDAAWAYQSFANDSSFLSLYVIQGDCSISRIRERILRSVINCQDAQHPGKLTYSRMRCRIVEKFGFYCWETLHPMDFCIDELVRYITNDPSAVLTEEQVLREIQRFIDQPLPEDQPQWQILVVPKFLYSKEHDYFSKHEDILEDDGFGNFDTITVKKKPGKRSTFYTGNHYYALVWRINHAMMDGLSAANCLQHCIADMPVKLSVDPLQTPKNSGFGLKLGMYLKMMVFGSRTLLRSMLQRDLNCFHGPGLTGPKSLGWSRGISLDTIRKIRKRNDGTTTTAVLASAVGSSLRGLALRKNNPVPKEIRAGVTCALLPYPSISPQNRFTVAHLKLKLELESHNDRLKYATGSTKELARSGDVVKNYGLIKLVGMMPKRVIPWFMDNCEATVLISNIPGPTEQYTIFQGQKLVDIIGWNTIKGNTAIGICLFSYSGRIRAGVIADGAVMPSSSDVPGLIEEFERDIVNLASDADVKEKDVFMGILT